MRSTWPGGLIHPVLLYILITPTETNISPENLWLEDEISFKHGPFSGDMLIFGGGGGGVILFFFLLGVCSNGMMISDRARRNRTVFQHPSKSCLVALVRFHVFVLCTICVDRVGHTENWWASSEKYGLCLTGGWCAFELHHRTIDISNLVRFE